MRFLLKIAFLVGLAAFFLAPARENGEALGPGLSPVAMLYGMEQAVSDLGGFCERAPAACETGREAIRFAGVRIGDGLALAYSMAMGQPTGVRDQAPGEPGSPLMPSTDAPPPPRGYIPPATGSIGSPRADGGRANDASPVAMALERLGVEPTAKPAMPGMPQPYRAPLALGIGDEADHSSSAPSPARLPVPRSAPRA